MDKLDKLKQKSSSSSRKLSKNKKTKTQKEISAGKATDRKPKVIKNKGWLQKSKLLFQLNPTAMTLFNLQNRKFVDVNDAFVEIMGLPRKEVLGKTTEELNIVLPLDERSKYLKQLQENGHIDNLGLKVRNKNGRIIEGLFSAELIESQAETFALFTMIDLTSSKKQEKERHQSEEKYRTILEDTREAYFELDLAGNFTSFNDVTCRNLGYSKDELIGMNNRQYIDKKNQKTLFQIFNTIYKTGEPAKDVYWQIITKNGEKKYTEGAISLLRDSLGNPKGFRGIARDITERKQTEEKLRFEEQRFRTLAENSPDIILALTPQGIVTYMNPAIKRILGFDPAERIGANGLERIHPDDIKSVTDKFLVLATDTNSPVLRGETRLRHKDGTWRTFETVASNIVNNNAVETIIINHRDITERKKADGLLKKSEEKYRLLAEGMKDYVWLMDMNLNFTYISPSTEKTMGYSLKEFQTLALNKFLTPASFKAAMDFFAAEMPKALAAPPTYILKRTLELEYVCKNGHTIWGEATFGFIRDENGTPVSLLCESREITERKQIEYELRASESNFRHSLDDSPLGVRVSTIAGETIYANRAILDIYGYDSIDELKKTPLKQRYTIQSYAQWQERKAKRLKGEAGPSEYDISIVRKNGEIRHLHVFRKAIFWDDNIQSQVIYQDITERKQAEDKLNKTLEDLRKSIKTTIQVLGIASEARDPYTAGHQKKVAHLARAIATKMQLPHDTIEGIRMAGAIHDIGKISIPSEILCKPSTLSSLEYSLIKAHTQYSYEIIKDVESPWPLAEIVYQHHERMNGSGYPRGLKGDEILIEARILAVADVLEAMISYRPYRPALEIEIALAEIETNAGILYDSSVAKTCLELFREDGFRL